MDGVRYERCTDTAAPVAGRDCHRSQQQGRFAGTARNGPEPGGAHDAHSVGRNEGKTFCG